MFLKVLIKKFNRNHGIVFSFTALVICLIVETNFSDSNNGEKLVIYNVKNGLLSEFVTEANYFPIRHV
jgi:hypothetical protein